MMSSGSSTEPGRASREVGLEPWHFYLLLAMAGATWAVIASPHTHPAALVLLSASIVAAGLAGAALHYALRGFFSHPAELAPSRPAGLTRQALAEDKAVVLRSIKELEFDRAMGKISERDFADIDSRLRARAMAIIEALEGESSSASGPTASPDRPAAEPPPAGPCRSCGTVSAADARFCSQCGARLA